MPDEINFEQDALPAPTNAQLSEIAAMAQDMLKKQGELAAAEAALKVAKEKLRVVEEDTLPTALQAMGLKSFTLADGSTIEVKTEYHAAISKAHKFAVFKWLREHELDALIKRETSIKFGKGEDAVASTFLNLIKKELPSDMQLSNDESVHPQTLKAFMKERITNSAELPRELLGVHEINRAMISAD